MEPTRRLYRLSLLALGGGLVVLAGVMLIGSGLGVWLPQSEGEPTQVDEAPVASPTLTPSATSTPVPTATPLPTPLPPTATVTSSPTPLPPTEPAPTPSATPDVTETTVEAAEVAPGGDGGTEVVPDGAPEGVGVTPPPDFERRDDPGSPFHERVWVGLYGTPQGRGLGILGTTTATETVSLAMAQALAYQEVITSVTVVPFFHMVVTIADPFPGPEGNYVHRVSGERLQLWIDVARQNGILSVVDIQPGYSSLATELAYVEPFVRQPGVHVALDPEFMMLDGVSIPGRKLGTMTGAHVNEAQAWLSEVAAATGERKVLVIHQFDDRMFVGKEQIIDYPLVDLVWDADGFGPPGPKIADYNQYAREPGFEYGGFKLFYDYDVPLMAPAEVLELRPLPAFVVYQ